MGPAGMPELSQSPLAGVHRQLGAQFAQFSGWSMPVSYTSVLAEHRAVRSGVGLFDVSHLGTCLVEGPGAAAYLNTRLANDLDRIAPGQAQYTLLLNQSGGIVDDLIAYLFSPDRVMLIANAANAAAVVAALASSAPEALVWTRRPGTDAILAVQGPASAQVLAAAGLPTAMGYMSFAETVFTSGGSAVGLTVCRTGYTGERGYEIVVPAGSATAVWHRLMQAGADWGIQPCGLGARDTLRTEMGYSLHGQDISMATSPVEARLGWAVGWKKASFDGAAAVRRQRREGVARTWLGLRAVGRAIPRPGMTILDEAGTAIGQVTSGTFSPTLGVGIGLGYVPAHTPAGTGVLVAVRGRREAFEVVKPPFVPSRVAGEE